MSCVALHDLTKDGVNDIIVGRDDGFIDWDAVLMKKCG